MAADCEKNLVRRKRFTGTLLNFFFFFFFCSLTIPITFLASIQKENYKAFFFFCLTQNKSKEIIGEGKEVKNGKAKLEQKKNSFLVDRLQTKAVKVKEK